MPNVPTTIAEITTGRPEQRHLFVWPDEDNEHIYYMLLDGVKMTVQLHYDVHGEHMEPGGILYARMLTPEGECIATANTYGADMLPGGPAWMGRCEASIAMADNVYQALANAMWNAQGAPIPKPCEACPLYHRSEEYEG